MTIGLKHITTLNTAHTIINDLVYKRSDTYFPVLHQQLLVLKSQVTEITRMVVRNANMSCKSCAPREHFSTFGTNSVIHQSKPIMFFVDMILQRSVSGEAFITVVTLEQVRGPQMLGQLVPCFDRLITQQTSEGAFRCG